MFGAFVGVVGGGDLVVEATNARFVGGAGVRSGAHENHHSRARRATPIPRGNTLNQAFPRLPHTREQLRRLRPGAI